MECVPWACLLLLPLLLGTLADPLPSALQVTQVSGGRQVEWNSGDRPGRQVSHTRPPPPLPPPPSSPPPPTVITTTAAAAASAPHISIPFTVGAARTKRSLPSAPHRPLLTPAAQRLIRQQQRSFRAAPPQARSLRSHARLRSDGRTKKNRGLKKRGRKHKLKSSSRPTVLRDAARATYVIRGTPDAEQGRLQEVPRLSPSSARESAREHTFRHYSDFDRRAEESDAALRSRASRQTAISTPDTIVKDGQIFHRHDGREERDGDTRGQSRRRHARPGVLLGLYDEVPQRDANDGGLTRANGGGGYFTAEALNNGGQSHTRVAGNVRGVDGSALTLNGGQLTQAAVTLGENSSSRAQITDHQGPDDPILASTVGAGQQSGAADARARVPDAATTHAQIEFSPNGINETELGEHGAASAVATPNGGSTLATLGGQTEHGSYLGTAHSSTLQVQPLPAHQADAQPSLGADMPQQHSGRDVHGLVEMSDMVSSIMETVHQPQMLPEVAALPPPPPHLTPPGAGLVSAREGLVGGSGVPPQESEIGRVPQRLHEEQERGGQKVVPQAAGQVGMATYFQGELGTPPNETDPFGPPSEDYRYDPSTYYDFNFSTDYLDPKIFRVEPLELDLDTLYPTPAPGLSFLQPDLTSHPPVLVHQLQTTTPDLPPHPSQPLEPHQTPTSNHSRAPDQPYIPDYFQTPDQPYIPDYTHSLGQPRLPDYSEPLDHIPDYSHTPDQSHSPDQQPHPGHFDTPDQPYTPEQPYTSDPLPDHVIPDYSRTPDHIPDYSQTPDHIPDYSQIPEYSYSAKQPHIPGYSHTQYQPHIQGYSQTPNGIPDYSQTPDRIPDYSQTPDRIPDYSQTPDRIPDYSQTPDHIPGYSHTPDHIPDYSQTPDRIPDYSQTPDRIPDHSQTPDYSQTPDRIPDYSQTPDHIPFHSDYYYSPQESGSPGSSQAQDHITDYSHTPEQPHLPDSSHTPDQHGRHQPQQPDRHTPAQPSVPHPFPSHQQSHTPDSLPIPAQPPAPDQPTRPHQQTSQLPSSRPSGTSVSARDRGRGGAVQATPMPMGVPLVPGQPGSTQTLPNGEDGPVLNVITMGADQSMKMSLMQQRPGVSIQPGEKIPGAPGYRVPAGFRGRVILGHSLPVEASSRHVVEGFNTRVRLTPQSPASDTVFASVSGPQASRQLTSEGGVPGVHVTLGGSGGQRPHHRAPEQHSSSASASHHTGRGRSTSRRGDQQPGTDHQPWTGRQSGQTRPSHRGQSSGQHSGRGRPFTSSTSSSRGRTSPPSKSWGKSWNGRRTSPQRGRKCRYFTIKCIVMVNNIGPQRQCQPSYRTRDCCC